MKLLQSLYIFLLAVGYSCADLLSASNITTSYACEDITAPLTNFADKLSSSSCTLHDEPSVDSNNGARRLGGNPNTELERLFNLYFATCQAICGCDPIPGRKLDSTKISTSTPTVKALNPVGDCDGSIEALEAIDLDLIESSSCIGTSSDGIYDKLWDKFCTGSESICDGFYYYYFCFRALKVEDSGRLLEEIENMTEEEVLKQMKAYGANPKGLYAKKTDVLPVYACNKVVTYLDSKKPEDFVRTNGSESTDILLTGEELIDIIGKDNARNLVDFFHESVGFKAPITKIMLQRKENKNTGLFTGHIDHTHTMITFLKQNFDNDEVNGGGIYHYLGNELVKTKNVTPGLTIVQGHDVLHKVYPWTGVRDVLDMAHDPKMKEAKCMLSDLLN